ncbi:MAG: hypothetical protein GF341_02105 [candidate division Zixibacteria bacterium]|nr:hypothetical protein [candidate division Zixibacteria bacterium]
MTHSTTLIGELTVAPGAPPATVDESVVGLINQRIQPPEPVTTDGIHVRSLRLISDDVNDHGGRFPAEEHERLCELIIDSPVLIGHDRTQLPMARNFAARIINDGDRQWISAWFYWLRCPSGDRLAADIDGGVVKEGSIGFEFRTPRCSICGNDIRRCEHIPGEPYRSTTGESNVAHYEYREIVRVLETSLVYRGATPGTRLGNEAVFCKVPDTVPKTHPDNTMMERHEPTLALVLDQRPRSDCAHEYLVARRSLSDVSVCDEFTITTDGQFNIGDLLIGTRGLWHRLGTVHSHKPTSIPRNVVRPFQ